MARGFRILAEITSRNLWENLLEIVPYFYLFYFQTFKEQFELNLNKDFKNKFFNASRNNTKYNEANNNPSDLSKQMDESLKVFLLQLLEVFLGPSYAPVTN